MIKSHKPGSNISIKDNFKNFNNYFNIMGDIRSHTTLGLSILEEIYDDMEDTNATYDGSMEHFSNKLNTMERLAVVSITTAIKGKPKLVEINESKEIEEYEGVYFENKNTNVRNHNNN